MIVRTKGRFGDWESDTVASDWRKPGVNTVLERKSGLVFITKLYGKASADTVAALARRLAAIGLPPEK